MIRNYRAVMASPVTTAMAARLREDVPGSWHDQKRDRIVVSGDALPFARMWFRQQGLGDTFTIEENPYLRNSLPRSAWRVPLADMPDIKPLWKTRAHAKQVEALEFWQDRQGALIELPTGRGKTFVGVAAACSYLKHGVRTLIVTPLPEQWLGAIGRITTGNLRAAKVVGRVGFEAIKVVPKPGLKWAPQVSRARVLAELASMPAKTQAAMVEAIRQGAANGKRSIPKRIAHLFVAEKVEYPPYWSVVRRSDRTAVQRFDLGSIPFPSPAENEALQAAIKSAEEHPDEALVAHLVLGMCEGYGLEAVAKRWNLEPAQVDEIVTEWAAESYCRIRSHQDLALPADTQVAVVSWALLVDRIDALRTWIGTSGTVILDESQEAKSRQRFRSAPNTAGTGKEYIPCKNQSWGASTLCEKVSRVMLLSATPDNNSIEDLWSQYDIICPKAWGLFPVCGMRYFGGVQGPHGMIYGRVTHPDEFRARSARVHFRASKAEMGESSPMVRTILPLGIEELTAPHVPIAAWKEAAKSGPSGTLTFRLAILAQQLHRWTMRRVKTALENGERIVLMTGLVSHAEKLHADCMKAAGPSVPVGLITGGVSGADRRMIIARHRLGAPAILVATADSIGVGTDGLQTSHRAIMLMLPWNHGELIQREGRFDRFDEDGERIVTEVEYPIPRDTVAEDILEVVLRKAEAAAEAFGSVDVKQLASDLAMEIAAEARPAALSAMAEKLLAASLAREEAARKRELEMAAVAVEAVADADVIEMVEDAVEVFHDPWLEE